MAAAKPPRATVVVPLVARPFVAWITRTPACAHSKAAMVPAAPPPTMSTSVTCRTIGMSSSGILRSIQLQQISGAGFDEMDSVQAAYAGLLPPPLCPLVGEGWGGGGE